MMQCRVCKADVDEAALQRTSAGRAAVAVLKDWRLWAFAFVVTAALGLLGGILGIRSMGAGSGAIIGIFVGVRLQKIRECPACKKASHFPVA